MKILQIEFKNINNLKGEHPAISFEKAPLSNAGIFAIIGPTGSGKSTLLDVITLALFNRVPRFKSKVSKKEIENLGSIVTHHTNDAMASVVYEIRGERYTSQWSISKNRNGNWKDYDMSLFDSSGKALDLKKSEVASKNEEIIGLNYDQFVKSIILSQGEFSKFLKADKNERGELLENLTGSDIYRRIGVKVFEKSREIKGRLDMSKQVLDTIEILSPEAIDAMKNAISKRSNEIAKQGILIKEMAAVIQIKKDLRKVKSDLASTEKQKTEFKEMKIQFQPQKEKLNLNAKLRPLQGDFIKYEDAKNNQIKTKKNLDEYQNQFDESKRAFEETIQKLSELTRSDVNKDNFMSVMSSFEKEIQSLDNKLSQINDRGKEIRDRINLFKMDYSQSLPEGPKSALDLLQQQNGALKLQKQATSIEYSNPKEGRGLLKEMQEEHSLLKDIREVWIDWKDNKQQISQSKVELEEEIEKSEQLAPMYEKSGKLIESYTQQIEQLDKRKLDNVKIASLEDRRQELVDGEPCPLCGSTDHPYTSHSPSVELSEIDKAIESAKLKRSNEANELKKLQTDISNATAKVNALSQHLDRLKEKHTEQKSRLDALKSYYRGKIDLNQADVAEKHMSNLKTEINHLEKSIEAYEELKKNDQLIAEFKNLDAVMREYKDTESERKEKFDGKKISPTTNDLQNRFQKHSASIIRLQEAISKETADQQRAVHTVELHTKSLLPKAKDLGFQSIEDMQSKVLNELEEYELQEQEEKMKKLDTEIQTRIETLLEREKSLLKEDKKPEQPLEKLENAKAELDLNQNSWIEELGKQKNSLETELSNKQKQEKELQKIQNLTKEYRKWELLNHLIGDATGNKFANFSQTLTLKNLLVLANLRLENLSDRYLLDLPGEKDSLQIVDKYLGNIKRDVSTLSGGESFLISLALALSLSDMASRNVSLDSLFIDEGFGTLDQETLEIAMETLEKLQTESQKTVGVISHVEALKQRISVQIRLNKNTNGYSSIEIVESPFS